MLKFPQAPGQIDLSVSAPQSVFGDRLTLPDGTIACLRVDIRIPPVEYGHLDLVEDEYLGPVFVGDSLEVDLSASLVLDIPLGNGSYEISREIVHGQNVYVPLDGSGAIAAIHREWGELESETRQAIARRKQAYSHL